LLPTSRSSTGPIRLSGKADTAAARRSRLHHACTTSEGLHRALKVGKGRTIRSI
jgi:hypothetical protein